MKSYLIHPKFGNGNIVNIYSNSNIQNSQYPLQKYVIIKFNNQQKTFLYRSFLLAGFGSISALMRYDGASTEPRRLFTKVGYASTRNTR